MTTNGSTARVVRLLKQHELAIEETDAGRPGPGEVMVRMAAGGICGSDLHYYHHGGFGQVRVREPIVLGHEGSGYVDALGEGVEGLEPGMLVAISPSQPCGQCQYCLAGLPIHCLHMRFLGSAMRMPHEQGLFRERMVVKAASAVPMGTVVSPAEAACTEPLSVCLHALRQAGDVAGKRVLVSGSGPIGVLAVASARLGGAREIVATDVAEGALAMAARMGATRTINVATDSEALDAYRAGKGTFDLAFECSGSEAAIATDIALVKPRATIVQVGIAGEATIPLSMLVGKEIVLRGSQRFHEEFGWAADLIASRTIDVRPIITGTYPLLEAQAAFDAASDRTRSCKVQIAFS